MMWNGSPLVQVRLPPATLLPTGFLLIHALAESIVELTQLPSLPINRFSIAGTSELNIVVVLSLPTLPSHAMACALVYVIPPTLIDATGHASGWFFQYPGVPVPGCSTAVVWNPKSVALPSPGGPVATLNPPPSGRPSLSNALSPTFGGDACVPVGISTDTVV